jgi:hypothetical protein
MHWAWLLMAFALTGRSQLAVFPVVLDTDPNIRMAQLIHQRDARGLIDPDVRMIPTSGWCQDLEPVDLKEAQLKWATFWFTDHPSHLTPERVHGSIQPN